MRIPRQLPPAARPLHRLDSWASLVIVLLASAGCAGPGASAGNAADVREFKCFGAGMDRKTCIGDASRLCRTGFDLYEKDVTGDDGVARGSLFFRCKP